MAARHVKIKAKIAGGGKLCKFAIQKSAKVFLLVDKYGTWDNPPHYYIGEKADIIWIKPARMNNHYGELEIK